MKKDSSKENRGNTTSSMGQRAGSKVGAVLDTKNKVKDKANAVKENIKDMPTQTAYAVYLSLIHIQMCIRDRHKDDIYYYPDCETMTDVAYYYIDELQALGDIPSSLQHYIDYEAYGRDLDMSGCFIATSRGICEIPY